MITEENCNKGLFIFMGVIGIVIAVLSFYMAFTLDKE